MDEMFLVTRANALEAAKSYCNLLTAIEQITDQLLAAIRSWNPEAIESLMNQRSGLCRQIGQHVPALQAQLDNLYSEIGDNSVPALDTAIDNIHLREMAVLEKQLQCDSALTEEMNSCKSSLSALNRGSNLGVSYRQSNLSPNARFLDSRH